VSKVVVSGAYYEKNQAYCDAAAANNEYWRKELSERSCRLNASLGARSQHNWV